MMILKRISARMLIIVLAGGAALLAGPDIKLRFLEGSRDGATTGPTAVTSSYEKLELWATVPANYSLDKEVAQIKKVFNIKDVKLITEADLKWPTQGDKIFHIIQFEGKEYLILVTPRGEGSASKFRVEVYEQAEKDKGQSNLLDTEFQLPANETVVLGFEDSHKTAYFLYLTWPTKLFQGGVEGGVLGGVAGGVEGGVSGGVAGGVTGGVEGSIVGGEEVAAPKVVKEVRPLYPEIARQSHVEGVVVLQAAIDAAGKVKEVKVLRSIPLLDQAAVDAVKQWVFEPTRVKGQTGPVISTVSVAFKLDDKSKKGPIVSVEPVKPAAVAGPVRAVPPVNPPKLLKEVAPAYPEIAKQAHVEGLVICEATTDVRGRVVDVKILRSIPLLDQAAISAVRQWVYEPVLINGKPTGIIFTVTVRFELSESEKTGQVLSVSAEDEEFARGATKVEGEIKPPKQIKMAAPVYPEEARKTGIEGVVILAARIDANGRVKKIKIIRSIPQLDQAAIDAVKQWEYEPLVVRGKPVEAVFTVTVRFQLK